MKCLFCFQDTGKIYFDKKGRPYFYDPFCSGRVFFRNKLQADAIIGLSKMLSGITREEFTTLTKAGGDSSIYHDTQVQKWVNNVENGKDVVVVKRSVENG